jgi:hypothetical protein
MPVWICKESENIETITEQVKCIFDGSKEKQTCYMAETDYILCSGIETCIVNVKGDKGDKITWKSSCGGYAYTTLDGENEYAKFDCGEIKTIPVEENTTSSEVWFKNAYWKCYDGYEEKAGGETSCKPVSVWKKYAEESCEKRCYNLECKLSNETTCANISKCGVNSFSVYNECPSDIIITPGICGNGICESNEGEICETSGICSIESESNETKCEVSEGKCYYVCPEDCKVIKAVYANLNEKFKLQVSQEVKFNDYPNLKIKFNNLFIPKCIVETIPTETVEEGSIIKNEKKEEEKSAKIETYSITGNAVSYSSTSIIESSKKCMYKEPYAVLQVKDYSDGKQKTEVIKIQVGEKKSVFDVVISFLDYDSESKTGVFIVSLNNGTFTCPKACICDVSGDLVSCRVIEEKCVEGTILCPDGVCREKCEVEDITTECLFGCFYKNKCLPYGMRSGGLYCSIDNDMKSQSGGDEKCENNFECESNICISGSCVSKGVWQKFLSWFKELFG